jgi:hypothetical protein
LIPAIKQVQTDDRNMNQLQNNIAFTLQNIIKNPIVDGVLLYGPNNQGISLAAGNTTINHTLGRKPLGYIICALKDSANIYGWIDSFNASDITLVSSVATKVILYVF